MQLQPIIKAKLAKFIDNYELSNTKEEDAFERFVNQTILASHQPDAFSVESDLLEHVSVGGGNDMGLDGICVKLNGILVSDLDYTKDLVKKGPADIEFIFIQSKYKEKFDYGEYLKFKAGVVDFLKNDAPMQPYNDNIKRWLEIKDYLFSMDAVMKWEHNPNVRLYYVVMGKWDANSHPHIVAASNALSQEINQLNAYGNVMPTTFVDAERFRRISNENDNSFNATINTIDTCSLTAVDSVDNSSVILCYASELIHLLTSEEGLIRKSLFDDNVRDYQGSTSINEDIRATIKNDPKSFILLNNGITIVCDKIVLVNRTIQLTNPQIVNGCQTCNVIYTAYRDGIDLSSVSIVAKVISTKNDDITNKIVKGTNRQNIVYNEAFEITSNFHKVLEQFFEAMSAQNHNLKLYYERRSKQYANNPMVKAFQKVNFRIVIQSIVGIFLDEPHRGHRHESVLLNDYKNRLFSDSQSKYPYYTACAIYMVIERKSKAKEIPGDIAPFKMHLAWIFKELAAGPAPNIDKEKDIEKYCNALIQILSDNQKCELYFRKACEKLSSLRSQWIHQKGENYRYGIKDSVAFTQFAKANLRSSGNYASSSIAMQPSAIQYRGTVVYTAIDKYGNPYGFISRDPERIFFHSKDNPSVNFSDLYAHDVLYEVEKTSNGNEKAVKVKVIK